jgi:hypothetical protein
MKMLPPRVNTIATDSGVIIGIRQFLLMIICMFCGRVSHLDEFCFRRKRIERCFEYARNAYRDEFFDFSPHSYSHALPRTSFHALSHFSHGSNQRSYDFGSRENNFVPRHFRYGSRPHRGDHFSVGLIFMLEGPTLTLSRDTWTIYVFSIVVHVPLG